MNHQKPKLFNPVLRISLTVLMISQILGARGEIITEEKPGVIRDAIVEHMLKRGYELDSENTSTIYLIYRWNGKKQGECYDQRWMFKLQDMGNKTSVSGYALCDTRYGAYPFSFLQIDTVIIDALNAKRTANLLK